MADLYYIDNKFVPESEARVPANDRGFNFADGVYEVIRVYNGKLFTGREHVERLHRSAREIDMPLSRSVEEYLTLCERFITESGFKEAMIYGQVTRGHQMRDHIFDGDFVPYDVWFIRELNTPAIRGRVAKGINLMSAPDERWDRCDIKSISLLPNVIAKNRAKNMGAGEAIFYLRDTGLVTEGSASNIWAVKNGTVYTAPDGPKILPGITRAKILQVVEALGLPIVLEQKPLDFYKAADEVVATSTTVELMPVRHIDETPLKYAESEGHGPIFDQIYRALLQEVEAQCGAPQHLAGGVAV